jgi:hypothetical protein
MHALTMAPMRAAPDTRASAVLAAALLCLAALAGAALPLLGLLVPALLALAALSLWVLLDFRAGVALAIVLTPLSALTLFPHELLGVRGLNPLNLILLLTVLSYAVHAALRRWREPLAPPRLLLWYVLPIAVAALVGVAKVPLIPPHFAADRLILFDDGAGYLRDLFFKPMLLVLLSLLVALAVRHSGKPQRLLYLMLASGWVLCLLAGWLLAGAGVTLNELASPLARSFLGQLGLHANEMSLLLNMLLALTLFSLPAYGPGWTRRLLQLSALAFALAVLLTFSRAGFAGLTLVCLAYWWRHPGVKGALAVLLLVAALAPFMAGPLGERLLTGVAGGDRGAVTAGRLDGIWLPLLPQVLADPLLPHGIHSILWSEPVRRARMLPVAQPHSAWLGALMDLGLAGFALVLAFLLLVRRQFARLARRHPLPALRGLFGGGAVLVPLWLLQGLTDDRFTPAFSQSYFWIALGMLIGCGGLDREKP